MKKKLGKWKNWKTRKIIITSHDPSPPSMKYLKQSGGIFRDMMIHDFDLLRFYLGNDEVKSILLQQVIFLIKDLIKLKIMN